MPQHRRDVFRPCGKMGCACVRTHAHTRETTAVESGITRRRGARLTTDHACVSGSTRRAHRAPPARARRRLLSASGATATHDTMPISARNAADCAAHCSALPHRNGRHRSERRRRARLAAARVISSASASVAAGRRTRRRRSGPRRARMKADAHAPCGRSSTRTPLPATRAARTRDEHATNTRRTHELHAAACHPAPPRAQSRAASLAP